MTRVFVTGSRGFVGTHLTRELQEHCYTVVGHDWQHNRECTGSTIVWRRDGDLAAPNVFLGALNKHQPDVVVHLAAQVGRLFGEDDLIHTMRSNAQMTALVAKYCGERKIPVIYASTSEVYGNYGERVCHEAGLLRPAENLYGLTKRFGEDVLRLYARDGLRILRLSMPAGPGAPPGRGRRAMDNFLHQAYHGMPILVHRGAERSWCHINDTVRGIRLIMEKGKDEVYNVGRDDCRISMLDLAKKACDLFDAPYSLIEEIDPPPRQIVVKRLSTQRLRKLGWRPEHSLDDILRDVADWIVRFDRAGKRVSLAA